jgi:HD domain
MSLSDLPVPTSAAAVAALEVVRAYSSPALVNHCQRSYLYAVDLGLRRGIAFDVELLYVAAMLHDLGLVEAFDAHRRDFETAGGDVAWVFAAGAGWPLERRHRVARVIVDHMRDDVDQGADPEGHLLMLATSLDISARRTDDWDAQTVREVLAAHPRLDLAGEFVACFTDQAARKPHSSAAAAMAGGIAERMARHPHEVTG